MDELLLSIINSQNFVTIFRLVLALLAGTLIGVERNRKGSPAGLKTHSLVCIGSALIMLLSHFLVTKYNIDDVTRMAAQVISGIGFLGAGTILVTGQNQIKGLTSAAGIWFSACVGLAIGSGFYVGAIFAIILEFTILKYISRIDFGDPRHTVNELCLVYNNDFRPGIFIKVIRKLDCEIISLNNPNLEGFKVNDDNIAFITINSKKHNLERIIESLKEIEGIIDLYNIS